MISNNELLDLIERIRAAGATVTVTYDEELRASEGREVIATVSVSGVRGIGTQPMAPIHAAERIREGLAAIRDYENKIEDKRERLEDRADRLRREGEARLNTGKTMFDAIPFGQPILVGHHSEKRDRNYRDRAWNNLGKGYATLKVAGEVAARAASYGGNGISSDDPTAVAQLREKLSKLEEKQEAMARANKLVRKFKNDKAAGAKAVAEAMDWSETGAAKLFEPDYAGRVGFASYELTNNNANIRRIKDRIEQLERDATRETKEFEADNGVRLVENVDDNRVQLFFPGKLPEAIRTMLKANGFRWSPTAGAWQRHLSGNAIWAARQVLDAARNPIN